MITKVDITRERSSLLDTFEAFLDFGVTSILPSELQFYIWGIVLDKSYSKNMLDYLPHFEENPDKSDDIFVAGIAKITIENVNGGELSVTLYEGGSDEFLLNNKGENIKLAKKWGQKSELDFPYTFGQVLNWPKGNCELSIYASGTANIEFKKNDCIPLSEYLNNTKKYTCLFK